MQSNYFLPLEKIRAFMRNSAMNNQYGVQLYGLTAPSVRTILPPPLELASPDQPLFYAYVVNIREPSFTPWYMEGGIGLMARYKEVEAVYFLGLQLSGPGALMGAFSGREGAGLPKKLCERIAVQREDDWGHYFIERKGTRLLDVRIRLGRYNDANFFQPQEACTPEKPTVCGGGCLVHTYRCNKEKRFFDMEILNYQSPTRYYSWEPGTAEAVLNSTPDDPWGDIPLVRVLGAGWMVSDNWVSKLAPVYRYPDEEAAQAMRRLFAGRYDQCTLGSAHQHYE